MLPLKTTGDEQEEWTENSAIIAVTEADMDAAVAAASPELDAIFL